MVIERTSIDGLLFIKSEMFRDGRGFFRESYRLSELEKALGRIPQFKQNNHSRSKPRVLRGFHREKWDKLIYVPRGTAFIAVADTRPNSHTFGKVETFTLGDEPGEYARIFVSEGLSNAFYCYSEVDYVNEVSEEFDPSKRGGIHWSDETLGVDWPDRDPIISDVDIKLPKLKEVYPDHPIFKGDS